MKSTSAEQLMDPANGLFAAQMASLMQPVISCANEDQHLEDIASIVFSEEEGDDDDFSQVMLNVIPSFLDMMDNYCDEKASTQFENALKDFQKCSRIDLMSFYETLYDSYAGIFFYCARYAFDSVFTMSTGRVPDQCMEALFGDNPTGKALRAALEHPGLEAKCYQGLYDNLPACTLKKWPLPLSGTLLKFGSCINKKSVPILEESCAQDFDDMDACLDDPEILKGKPRSQKTCDKWTQRCVGIGMNLPPPLNAIPLSDVCKHKIDLEPQIKEKYEAYRKSCISPEDIHYWEEGDGKASLSSLKYYSSDGREGGSGNSIAFGLMTTLGFITLVALVMYSIVKGNRGNTRSTILDTDDSLRLDRTVEMS